jgi:hypothetical protein
MNFIKRSRFNILGAKAPLPLAEALVIDPYRDINGRNILPVGAEDFALAHLQDGWLARLTLGAYSNGFRELFETVDNDEHYEGLRVTCTAGITYTLSVIVKPNGRGFFAFQTNALGGWVYNYFNITTGVVVSTAAGYTGAISDSGGGAFRCSITFTATTTGDKSFCLNSAIIGTYTAYAGDVTKGILVSSPMMSLGGLIPYSAPAGLPQILNNYGYSSGGHAMDGQNGSSSGADSADATWNQKGLSFPDGTDYITLPATPNVGDCTVMVVARTPATFNWNTLYARNNVLLQLKGSKNIYFRLQTNGGDYSSIETPANALLPNQLYLFTARVSGGKASIDYLPIDSVPLLDYGSTLQTNPLPYGHYLGGYKVGDVSWLGDIAFSAEWGKCLSDAEVIAKKKYITDLMFSRGIVIPGVSPLYGAMAVYDPYLQVAAGTTGQTLFDTSGNGNHMTLGSTAGSDSADPAWGAMNLSFPDGTDYAVAAGKCTTLPKTIINIFKSNTSAYGDSFLSGCRDASGSYGIVAIDSNAGAKKIVYESNLGSQKRVLLSTAGNIDYAIPRCAIVTTDYLSDQRIYLGDVPQDVTTPNDYMVNATGIGTGNINLGGSSAAWTSLYDANLYFSAMLPYTVTDSQVTAIYAYLKALFASRGLNFQDDTPLMGASVLYDPALDVAGRNIWTGANTNPLAGQYNGTTKFTITPLQTYCVSFRASSISGGRIGIDDAQDHWFTPVTLSATPQLINVTKTTAAASEGSAYFLDLDNRGDIVLTDIQVNIGSTLAPYSAPLGSPQTLKNRALSGATYDAQLGSTSGADTADPSWGVNALVFPDGTDWLSAPLNLTDKRNFTTLAIANKANGVTAEEHLVEPATGGYCQFFVTNNTLTCDSGPTATLAISPYQWHLLGYRQSTSGINGMCGATIGTTISGSTNLAGNSFYIGRLSTDNWRWQGSIGNVVVFPWTISNSQYLRAYAYLKTLMSTRGITI